jgi:hypothetical protein
MSAESAAPEAVDVPLAYDPDDFNRAVNCFALGLSSSAPDKLKATTEIGETGPVECTSRVIVRHKELPGSFCLAFTMKMQGEDVCFFHSMSKSDDTTWSLQTGEPLA